MMSQKLILCFLFLLLSSSAFCQLITLHGKVYAQDKNTVLPFVNITVTTKNTVGLTDEKGDFEIQVSPADTLVFSMVGYQTLRVVAAQCTGKILMLPQVFELPELTVIPARMTTHEVGLYHAKRYGVYSGFERIAVFIPNPANAEGTIQKVYYRTVQEEPTIEWKVFHARVRIYRRDPQSGLPAEDLLTEPVIVEVRKNPLHRKIETDLSKYQLAFPAEGAFVGLDLIGFTDQKGRFTRYTEAKENLKIVGTDWETKAHTYCYQRGRWLSMKKHTSSLMNARFGAEVKIPE